MRSSRFQRMSEGIELRRKEGKEEEKKGERKQNK
jgi:hypothetical protein